ncbi:hypothetical protein ACFP2T_37460 [Plantactinospora solaniradicis]|uniref:Uncharacterized protein n=1 Tax=Plantactinospora solaniradicis TaxID=1723736 RepID=A0ABW1KLS5_9ACTN
MTVQETLVGEGLAAGCLSLGVSAVTTDFQRLNSSFARTWPAFPPAGTMFRGIKATLVRNDIRRILDMSSERRSHNAAWENRGAWWVPYISQDGWKPDDVTDLIAEGHGIPAGLWTSLAEAFVTALGDGHVRRVDQE